MSTNPLQPQVSINIGGTDYNLHYAHRDFATAEYKLRKQGLDIYLLSRPKQAQEFWGDLMEIDKIEGAKVGLFVDQYKLAVCLYVGLIRERPDLTFEEVQDLITFQNCASISSVVMAETFAALTSMVPKEQLEAMMNAAGGGDSEGPEEDEADPTSGSASGTADGPTVEQTSDSTPANSGN